MLSMASPSWLYKIAPEQKSDIIGYGVDKSLVQAKQNALSDISQAIHVDVDSSVKVSASDDGGNLKESSSMNLQTSSKTTLSGTEFIEVEKVDGVWYVAVKYDNSPLDIKLKKLLPKDVIDEKQNGYLKNTPLIKELNEEIGKTLDYEIVRKDNLWQLQYKDILLPLNKKSFYKLFSDQSTQSLSIIPNQKIYQEDDEMYFKIRNKKSGYVSIIYVEHDGKVGLLLENKKYDKTFMFPDLKTEDVFKIANPYGKTIRELYIVINSENEVDLHKFESVSSTLLDESNYNFDKLINKLDSLEFSTYEIKIRK